MGVSAARRAQVAFDAPRPYRGPDRRTRTPGAASSITLGRTVPLTLVIALLGGAPAILVFFRDQGTPAVSSFLMVSGGILVVAAGVTCLLAWRIVGLARPGWFGVAFVSFGLLTLTDNALTSFGVHLEPDAVPFGRLVGAAVASALLWRGIHEEEVNAAFSPVAALLGAIGAGTIGLGLASVVDGGSLGVALRASVPLNAVAGGLSAAAWLVVTWGALLGTRRRPAVPAWVVAMGTLFGLGSSVSLAAPQAQWSLFVSAVPIFIGSGLALGASLMRFHELLQSDNLRQLRLARTLDDTRRQAAVDHEQLEDWLHDLRNAVAALRAADSVLRSGNDRDIATRVILADAVTAELARLAELVEPARSLAAVDFSLQVALGPVVAAERALGARIECHLGDVAVHGDKDVLVRAVQNVLVNARFHAPGSAVQITAARRGGEVDLTIHDDGPGIPAGERLSVFGRGMRGTPSAGTEGSGLGLFVARSLLQAMGGDIRLASDERPGSTFVLTVPAAARAAPESTRGTVAGSSAAVEGGAGRLLSAS